MRRKGCRPISRNGNRTSVAVKKIAVLGAGTMGHGIAHAAMTAGYDTALYDVSQAAVD